MDRTDDITHAQWQRDAFGLPEYTYQAFRSQYHSAKQRDIPFRFTLYGWHVWWKRELAKIGPDAKRGLRKGEYMMCRINDAGAYEDGNVYAGTPQQNQADIPLARQETRRERIAAWHATHDCWLKGMTGDAHPRSKPIVTPKGRFGSANLAAHAYGITRQAVHYKLRRGEPGWAYE